jgi:hypothetical protein
MVQSKAKVMTSLEPRRGLPVFQTVAAKPSFVPPNSFPKRSPSFSFSDWLLSPAIFFPSLFSSALRSLRRPCPTWVFWLAWPSASVWGKLPFSFSASVSASAIHLTPSIALSETARVFPHPSIVPEGRASRSLHRMQLELQTKAEDKAPSRTLTGHGSRSIPKPGKSNGLRN